MNYKKELIRCIDDLNGVLESLPHDCCSEVPFGLGCISTRLQFIFDEMDQMENQNHGC
jgi:hypothetical protein